MKRMTLLIFALIGLALVWSACSSKKNDLTGPGGSNENGLLPPKIEIVGNGFVADTLALVAGRSYTGSFKVLTMDTQIPQVDVNPPGNKGSLSDLRLVNQETLKDGWFSYQYEFDYFPKVIGDHTISIEFRDRISGDVPATATMSVYFRTARGGQAIITVTPTSYDADSLNFTYTLNGKKSLKRDGEIKSITYLINGVARPAENLDDIPITIKGYGWHRFVLQITYDLGETSIDSVTYNRNQPQARYTHGGGVKNLQEEEFDATKSTEPFGKIVKYEYFFKRSLADEPKLLFETTNEVSSHKFAMLYGDIYIGLQTTLEIDGVSGFMSDLNDDDAWQLYPLASNQPVAGFVARKYPANADSIEFNTFRIIQDKSFDLDEDFGDSRDYNYYAHRIRPVRDSQRYSLDTHDSLAVVRELAGADYEMTQEVIDGAGLKDEVTEVVTVWGLPSTKGFVFGDKHQGLKSITMTNQQIVTLDATEIDSGWGSAGIAKYTVSTPNYDGSGDTTWVFNHLELFDFFPHLPPEQNYLFGLQAETIEGQPTGFTWLEAYMEPSPADSVWFEFTASSPDGGSTLIMSVLSSGFKDVDLPWDKHIRSWFVNGVEQTASHVADNPTPSFPFTIPGTVRLDVTDQYGKIGSLVVSFGQGADKNSLVLQIGETSQEIVLGETIRISTF